MDQMGIILLLVNNTTYHEKDARQVEIAGCREKRAYTLCVTSTASGEVLPFQQVWSGKTKASTPSKNAPGYDEAMELGMDFTVANLPKKTSHFSTVKTMKEWIYNILLPYVRSVVKSQGLPEDQKSVLFIDLYLVHIGTEFCVFVLAEFLNVFLIYVPANCTGLFQPADVGLQRIIKHFLCQENLDYLIGAHTEQLKNGLTPEQVKFTTSLSALRDALVQPLISLFKFLQSYDGRKIIQKAWEKCKVKDLNLEEASLTSQETKATYRQYYLNDKTFREEIERKIGAVPGMAGATDLIPEMEPDSDHEDSDDEGEDTNLPLNYVICDAVNHELVQDVENSFMVTAVEMTT